MFNKVLIANRGEIALRVARACRELGIGSVAVYSTADADSAVVRFADEAVQIGPPATGRSYLHIPSLIGAAKKTGADALHPGYGFLSEDPYFAEICTSEGITFIGPRPEVMEKVGDKATARQLMQEAGLPLLPGTVEPVNTLDEARDLIKRLEGSTVQRFSVEAGDTKIEIERGMAAGAVVSAPMSTATVGAVPVADEAAGAAELDGRHPIKAPLVGTFYRSPTPGAPAFVQEGDVVDEGQTVAIVEAMKLMNQVQADQGGKISEIVAEDGQWVEFEQTLMLLEPPE